MYFWGVFEVALFGVLHIDNSLAFPQYENAGIVLESLYISFSTQGKCPVPRIAVKDCSYNSKVTDNFYFSILDHDGYMQILFVRFYAALFYGSPVN